MSLCLEGPIQNCELIVEEWQAIHLVLNQTPLPATSPSISEIIPMIARLGGYLGRKRATWSKIYLDRTIANARFCTYFRCYKKDLMHIF